MRHTMTFTKVIYLCCLLLHSTFALQLPPSPCPNVFTYEGDAESDRWHGVITFSSNIELVGMNYKVQLDRPSQLLVSWDGEVRSDDNTNYNVFDPFHTQRGGEVVKARIMVKFNPNNGIPGILKIVINGNTMCARDGNWDNSGSVIGLSAESTKRPDPSFNEGDDTSESSNNRYPSNSYNENPSNYESNQNFERPSNRPSYNNEGSYSGSNYNSRPNYSNSQTTNSPVYVVNPSNTGSNSNSYQPSNSNGYSGSGGSYTGQNTYSNSEYSNGNRPQWSDNSNNYNRTNNWQSNSFSNSPSSVSSENANGGPVVTTLTIPNTNTNKTNVDQIVQIIKNQLEQQQISAGSNKTVIVAVVNSLPNSGSPINSNNSATTTDTAVIYRTTTIPTSTASAKAKIVVSTAKSSSSNGHTSRP